MVSKNTLITAFIFIVVCTGIGVWFSIAAAKNKPVKDCMALTKLGFNWHANGNDEKFIENEDMKFGYYCAKFPKIGGANCIEDYCQQKSLSK